MRVVTLNEEGTLNVTNIDKDLNESINESIESVTYQPVSLHPMRCDELLDNRFVMLVDEDAKLKNNKELNVTASWMHGADVVGQTIVGKVSFVKVNEEGTDFEELSEDDVKVLEGYFLKIDDLLKSYREKCSINKSCKGV